MAAAGWEQKTKETPVCLSWSGYHLLDCMPATTMVWLLVFCYIDVNCQLWVNGKQLLPQTQALQGCTKAAASAGSKAQRKRNRQGICLLSNDMGILEPRCLHTLTNKTFYFISMRSALRAGKGSWPRALHPTAMSILTGQCRAPSGTWGVRAFSLEDRAKAKCWEELFPIYEHL